MDINVIDDERNVMLQVSVNESKNCAANSDVDILDDELVEEEEISEQSLGDDDLWNWLAEEIIEGNVIPVIGDNIVLEGGNTVKKRIIQTIAAKEGITCKPNSYSQLLYDENYKKDRSLIYTRIRKLLDGNIDKFRPSEILTRILSIKQFPFVITTTTDYVIERAMRDIWAKKGRKLETLIFDNNPKNIRTQGDIKSKDGIELPTLYYMFGKANDKEHSFVVTDEDMLAFCQSWLTESVRPEKLSREIGEKFLLFLGCNYPDWLVRFIWYSMRKNLNKSGMLVDDCAEDSLVAFLNRVNVKTQKNIEYVVSQIENRIEKIEQRSKAKFQTPQEKTDVFISYSRTNEKEARSLYDALTARGLNVWYDREKLNLGDDWFVKIKKSIESTKFFVALLSADMKEQVNDSKVYRKEWNIAIDHARGMSPGRGFIIPICIGEVDMLYKDELDIPMELVAHNATTLKKLNEYDENQKFKTLNISEKEDYDNIADKIIKRLDDLF